MYRTFRDRSVFSIFMLFTHNIRYDCLFICQVLRDIQQAKLQWRVVEKL